MSCRHFATYTNGYGHKVCSDCGRVIEPETTASDSTETPKRMKPLDKLEQMMFKVITGWDYDEAPSGTFNGHENTARECAQVAKDLARRAHVDACNWLEGQERQETLFKSFLTSEGITE